MTKESFEEQIKKELRDLDREQIIQFAWRCGIRALPFFGYKGDFSYWKKEPDIQKNLFKVFYALDAAFAVGTSDSGVTARVEARAGAVDVLVAADAVNAAAVEATKATTTFADASDIDATLAANAAILATAYASTAASLRGRSRASVATNACSAAVSAAKAANYVSVAIQDQILEDLESVKGLKSPVVSTESFEKIWRNFQEALINIECEYWGRLYQGIYENNFKLDQGALKRRLRVPKEIRDQGAKAVANYLMELERGEAKRLNEARIIILGDKGAGKTSLAKRLVDPNAKMPTDQESTKGVDTSIWTIKDKTTDINVSIWDFAGHTVTHAAHQFFLSERCLYIMVYDGRTEDRNRLEYWLDHMKNFGGDSKAYIVVNQRDDHIVDIPINYLKEQYEIINDYAFSIKGDSKELKEFRVEVSKFIKHNPSWEQQEIPESYYKVKEELEQLFIDKKKEHVTKEDFDKIAERNKVDDIERLLKDLNALGVSLWYNNLKNFGSLVLNPNWISYGVYQLINWLGNHKQYSLSLKDFKIVFADELERYPEGKCHQFFFDLMKHYELAYEGTKGKSLVVPHLLKEDRPKELPDFGIGESLKIQYNSKQQLPANTISRFIVKHNEQIKAESLVWRYGVVLTKGKGNVALVREEDRTISVSVKGPDKSDFIAELRETLNEIFDSYKSKKPELQYGIERFGEITADEKVLPVLNRNEVSEELFLSESKILNHFALKKHYFDDETNRSVPIEIVINNYKIEAQNYFSQSQLQTLNQNTFNFKDCNLDLQGSLDELSQLLQSNGNKNEANKIDEAKKLLESLEGAKNKEEVRKKGALRRLGRIVEDMGDEKSKLHKLVSGLEYGVGIAQDIAKYYNGIAQWVGWPQVPKPLLGDKDKDKKE